MKKEELSKIWQGVLGEIELSIGKATFNTWFSEPYIDSLENNKVIIRVPSGFHKERLEAKYSNKILKSLQKHIPEVEKIEFLVGRGTKPKTTKASSSRKFNIGKNIKNHRFSITEMSGLNPKYDFGTFIIGSNNALAEAAAKAVSDMPGKKFNPLFIYGGVGLGKTHLLQAIGNEIAKKRKDESVKYSTTESFSQDLLVSLRTNKMTEFKDKYRKVDILLIDDIQFIGGKEKTQEEFFHTFNHLYQAGKQVVICSDRSPSEIKTLQDRLKSRFEGGMMADISQPDLETRTAILDSKARDQGLEIKTDVLEYIASNIQNNVRELEGALNKYIATCQLQNWDMSLKNAKMILAAITSTHQKQAITPQFIVKKVCKFFNISNEDIMGTSRRKDIVRPRQFAICLMRKEGQFSYPVIGKFFNKDHSTIMHSYRKISSAVEDNETILREFNAVRDYLYRN